MGKLVVESYGEFLNESGPQKWTVKNDKHQYFNFYFKKFTKNFHSAFTVYKDLDWAKRDAEKYGGVVTELKN